jgi:DNA adenine methylase
MTVGTFNYPGGKTTIANWIIEQLPDHEVYVEPFGGSAGVLANKPESPLEVYNDTASLCVDFFRAVKHRPDELQHWVQTTPYSRELFDEYTGKLQKNPPDDLVERAGMFWYTQIASFAGKGVVNTNSPHFSINTNAEASKLGLENTKNAADNITGCVERFRKVQIEHLDFKTVFEKYDSQDTVFYCDPPYVDVGDDYYQTEEGGFDHARFVESLKELDGDWLVSYDHNIPDGLRDYTTMNRSKNTNMDHQKDEKTESLIMNYDPNDIPMFRDTNQEGLEAYE